MKTFEEKYISEAELNEWRKEIDEFLATLNGFINYLLRAKQGRTNVEEPEESYGAGTPINY